MEGVMEMNDVSVSLPQRWKLRALKEITSVLGDGLHGTPKYSNNGEYYFINGNNLNDGRIDIKRNTKRVSFEEYKKYKKPLNNKSILVSINGSLGYTAFYNNENVVLGKSACYFNVIDSIDKHYVRYYLTTERFKRYAEESATGSTIKNVGLKAMREFLVPFPDTLEEQQAIVSKIEELLSELDKGKQQLETAQQQLRVYRQAVLKWAFHNLMEEKSIEEITEEHSIGLVRSSKDQNESGIGLPYIKMNNLDLDGNIDFKSVVFVNVSDSEADKYSLKKGDILINTRNSIELVGKTGIVRQESGNYVFNNNLLRLRTKKEFDSLFIGYQLISPSLRRQMTKEKKSTTNVCALYQRDIFPLKVKITGIDNQLTIVREIESRLSVCDKVEETITTSLAQAETLRQGVLKKAFEGKLI